MFDDLRARIAVPPRAAPTPVLEIDGGGTIVRQTRLDVDGRRVMEAGKHLL